MTLSRSFATLALLLGHVSRLRATEEKSTCSEDGTCISPDPSECQLYVAPSTIPNSGLGIFTAVPLKANDTIGYGDVILPLIELEFHQGTEDFFHPFSEYMWDASAFGMELESDVPTLVNAFAPGLDAMMNCNMALINVERGDFVYDDDVGGHRGESPSAGSMTPYHNYKYIAKYDVPAGGELFRDYGDRWFTSRKEEFGLIPLKGDYLEAERLLKAFGKLQDRLNLPDTMRRDLHSILATFPLESRVTNAFPREYAQMNVVVEKSMRELHQLNATRSLDELGAVGRCLDNIRHDESTLQDAGRGAFATRFIPKDTIVTGSPVMHVPDDELAEMYDTYFDEDMDATVRDPDAFLGYQLWFNYCMSHPNTTIMLCPYGSGIGYMNHDKELANIRIQWAPHGKVAHNESWFLKSPQEMEHEWTGHLGMDYVAIRDIEEGEELFLDYGKEWEETWEEHYEEWEPTDEDEFYISAAQWNKRNAKHVLRTEKEQEINRYPPNLMMRCHPFVYDENSRRSIKAKNAKELWPSWEKGHPCQVFSRTQTDDGKYVYTVQLFQEDHNEAVTRRRVERRLIAMIDQPFTTNLHMLGRFRHYIGIPDEMMPDAWLGR